MEDFDEHEEHCDDIYCKDHIEKKSEDGDIDAMDEGFMLGYNDA